jgi:hypothetical protein
VDLHERATSLGLQSEAKPNSTRAFELGLELAAEARSWLFVTGFLALIGAVRWIAAAPSTWQLFFA